MQIKIEGLIELKDKLGKYDKQLPFALSKALNDTAYGARGDVIAEMKRVLDRPTPYILKSAVYAKAKKDNLTSTVALVDPAEFVYDLSGGEMKSRADQAAGPPPPALIPQMIGGPRAVKPFEKMIQDVLGLSRSTRIVPGKGAWLDQYGNVSHGEIVKILSDLRAHRETGYVMNKRGKSKGYYRNFRYFVLRRGGRPIGVFAREHRSQSVQPVLLFVSGATYKKRFDFQGVVKHHVKKNFHQNFQKAIQYAIKTAR